MIEALAKGMEAGAWAFGAAMIFAAGVLLVLLGIAGLMWAFGDEQGTGDSEGMEPRDEEGERTGEGLGIRNS